MKKVNKLVSLVLALVMCLTLAVPAMAADGNPQVKNYSSEETQRCAQEYVDQIWNNNFAVSGRSNVFVPDASTRGSFYTEYPNRYIPDYAIRKENAFPIQEYTYDRTGQPTKDVTVTYTNSTSVEWSVSGALKGAAEFAVINAEMSIGVARSSTVGSSASSSVPYSLKGGHIYSITIYAHGVDTVGAIQYRWNDIDGNSGYITRPVSALLPYATYTKTSGIHFGPALIIG